MGSRLQNASEDTATSGRHQPYTFSLASLVDGGNMPGVALPHEQNSSVSKPTGLVSPVHSVSRRKVIRSTDEKSLENGTEQTSRRPEPHLEARATTRSREDVRSTAGNVLREDSPRRVDFTRTLQLREVNWDGTYQDSLAYPPDIHGTSDSTSTNSKDLRETDIHFLNFSRVPGSTVDGAAPPASVGSHTSLSSSPYAPPPSASNSLTNYNLFALSSPPSTSSSSFTYTSSSSTPPSSQHRHAAHTQQHPDVRWVSNERKLSKSGQFTSARVFGKAAGSKHAGPKLALVDLQLAGSARTSSTSSQSPAPSLTELKRRELVLVRRHVEEKWATSNHIIDVKDSSKPRQEGNAALRTPVMDGHTAPATQLTDAALAGRLDLPRTTAGLSLADGATGGLDMNTSSPKRPLPMKMPITADLKDDEILLKLKERLKHQRALASISSTTTSNDTSLANSSDSPVPPPALPPRHPITKDTTPRVPASRKVAASHPSPSYRGFSGPDQQTPSSKSNTKWSGVKKKTQNLKKPVLQPKKQETEISSHVRHPAPTPAEKPKKASRVVATTDKTSKPSKNIITTSAWRTAQELVKELGLAPKSKSKPAAQQTQDPNKTVTLPDHERQNQLPDGAEADSDPTAAGHCHSDGITDTRHLSQEAKSVLNDIQAGLTDSGTKPKIIVKPAVKRKAPKPSEPDKSQQPCEKTRHYDQESVRKFIAEQKAKRMKKQLEEKMASKKANEKKHQLLQELVERQKKQAVKSAALGRLTGDGDRKRKRDEDMKENLGGHGDDSTLTGESADDSTPHITPRDLEDETAKQKKTVEKITQGGLSGHYQASHVLTDISANCDTQEMTSGPQAMDVDSILDRFSQVVSQRRKQETSSSGSLSSGSRPTEFKLQGVFSGKHYGDETAFAIGTSNSIARTNEKRKEAIKATALTLQSKLAEERKRLEDVHILDTSHQFNSGTDYVSRYSRLTGANNDYNIFTSNLPGSQHYTNSQRDGTLEHEALAATRIQAAYRGHNVRQALNWQLPSGQTFGQRLKGNTQVKVHSGHQPNDDVSDLTETSTFSEITRSEPLGSLDLDGNRRSVSAVQNKKESSSRNKPTPATYKPPSQYAWVESKPDPYSVMSVFSRQNRYLAAGSRQADMPYQSTAITVTTTTTTLATNTVLAAENVSHKQPTIMSVEHVTIGQTGSGQPVVAKSRYTRVEATVSEPENSDVSTSHSESASPVRSSRPVASVRSNDIGSKSEPAYTMTYESCRSRDYSTDSSSSLSSNDDEDQLTPVKKSVGYKWQMSDAGVETDVSQMSEDEPRNVRSKLESVANRAESQDRPPAFASRGPGDGRLSPNSLANKFSASLTYMESMEESLRQVVGMERTRGICLAQQETVSLAQVLKARQQEHSAELRALQLQARKEAVEATQQLDTMKTKSSRSPAAGSSVSSLLEKDDNLRPESRSNIMSRSSGRVSYSTEDLSKSPDNRRTQRSSGATSVSSKHKLISTGSATLSIETAEDSQNSSQSSVKTAQDSQDSQNASISEVITKADDSYSMSFDETLTDEESFRQVLPSESHRKEARRHSGEFKSLVSADASTSHALNDLSSLFAGEDSFSKFTAEMVRQIMKEEEYRAQHQAALLSLRQKALQEKAKAELAWLQQLKQKPHNKGADDVFPNIDKREKKIKQNLKEQQAEIRRLQEANELASKERQLILQQHEEIAKIKQTTQATLNKLQVIPAKGRLARPAEVHTEDETEVTTTEDIKDSKSDSEVYKDKTPNKQGNKQSLEKQQKMRLDVKYMTAREQRLHERKKQAKELLEWKKRLDAEEQKVYQLEKKAIEAWEAKHAGKKVSETAAKKTAKIPSPSKVDDSNVISDHILSSLHDELDGTEAKSKTVQQSISEVISTQLSTAESVREKRSRSESKEMDKTNSSVASGSESSIPEDIPPSSRHDKHKAQDSGDDTVINTTINEDYPDTFERELPSSISSRRKSPVGKLLPHTNSPLPSPWSRKPGSESESEDSISHTETLSDASDYEARIRQLSDELRRRRKEVEMLKKERSRRQKEKFKAQEEAMKKQLEAYNNYIQQLKQEKDELEHESPTLKSVVKPQIKQPHGHHPKTRPHRDETASNSSSFEEMKDSPESKHSSPSAEGKDTLLSSGEDKSKKKAVVSLMDKISEGTESVSDLSGASVKSKEKDVSSSSNVEEIIEEVDTNTSEKTVSDVFKIQTQAEDNQEKVPDKVVASVKDDDASYTLDFSDMQSSLAQSYSRVPLSARSQGSLKLPTDSEISEHIEDPASARSASARSQPKLDYMSASNIEQEQAVDHSVSVTSPATGIQESDSDETESRRSSRKSESSSRPSSERSTVSNVSYTDMEDDVDVVSSGSEKTPVKSSQRLLPDLPTALSVRTEDDISEHITGSLPSISDRQKFDSRSYKQSQEVLDSLLGYTEEEENELDEDKTPVATPREMAQTPVPDEDVNEALLQTDPLVDFSLGDRVLVLGSGSGILRFKGKVDFSPGIWAGVELDAKASGSDGFHEGKRYFTCPAGHGVLVQGSEISAEREMPVLNLSGPSEDVKSPDDSALTDHEDLLEDKTALTVNDESIIHSTPLSSPYAKASSPPVRHDLTQLAESITDHLTNNMIKDSVMLMEKITQKKASQEVSLAHQQPTQLEKVAAPKVTEPKSVADQTTDSVMKSLLEEAIADMVKIKKRKLTSQHQDSNSSNHLSNGHIDDKELFLEDKLQDNDSGLSLEAIHRPSSPLPGDHYQSLNHKMTEELGGLLGEYIDDDLGFEPSSKPPPPYPGSEQTQGVNGVPPAPRPVEVAPVVPLTREAITPIISRAVDIYWNNRRYGESLDGVEPPHDFLSEDEETQTTAAVTESRKSWKKFLFDLTGEIIRDIYQNEDKPEPPVWQKIPHQTPRFFKGNITPTTVDALKPIVEASVLKLLDLNGTRKALQVNKWNIRKKKDLVDAVLSQELAEDERGWVDYSSDELSLKITLTDSLFDSLLSDTVQTVNGIYQRRQHSPSC
ncbi:centrosome-associated protein 350-like isoform X3 [Biomphalaria glabrata]|nr:centrosome-associated protein 350-like isoform X3 [Biomphalaria glabrata]XP_055897250.1 centrosome-associated protein 350-like isoform X3 [Biomphalaria glabrata]XP_055897251.1 centrosome-associated protein 350-like isoform X3 [Biomphalaria glabrata]